MSTVYIRHMQIYHIHNQRFKKKTVENIIFKVNIQKSTKIYLFNHTN